jgi:hypothetical protein
MKTISLRFVWKLRLSLRAEGNKLWAECDKLLAEANKLRAEGNKLWVEGNKLWAERDKLWAEGDKLWAEAVIEAYGNVTIEWHSDTKCTVDGTDIFDDSL